MARTDLSCGQLVTKQHIGDKGEDGDDHRQGGPGVHTHGIQVLEDLQAGQLPFAVLADLLGKVLLPVVELENPDPNEHFRHEL